MKSQNPSMTPLSSAIHEIFDRREYRIDDPDGIPGFIPGVDDSQKAFAVYIKKLLEGQNGIKHH